MNKKDIDNITNMYSIVVESWFGFGKKAEPVPAVDYSYLNRATGGQNCEKNIKNTAKEAGYLIRNDKKHDTLARMVCAKARDYQYYSNDIMEKVFKAIIAQMRKNNENNKPDLLTLDKLIPAIEAMWEQFKPDNNNQNSKQSAAQKNQNQQSPEEELARNQAMMPWRKDSTGKMSQRKYNPERESPGYANPDDYPSV